MNGSYLFIVSSIILISCGNEVRFEVPQPEGVKDEQLVPKKLLGTYMSLRDSSILIITTDLMTRKVDRKFVAPKTSMDSSFKIKGDTSFYNAEEKVNLTVQGDSVYGDLNYTDTLFHLSKTNVLRKYAGYYFLNKEVTKNDWDVNLLNYQSDKLTIITVWNKSDLDNIRKITRTKSEVIQDFRPTKKQLKEFIREKGLQDVESFTKIKSKKAKR